MVTPKLVAKIESEKPAHRLAVLIDADNAQAAVIDGLLAEIARFGEATVKRIYGDFTASTSASWKKVLQQYAIKPVQQFAYTKGKNGCDGFTLYPKVRRILFGQQRQRLHRPCHASQGGRSYSIRFWGTQNTCRFQKCLP